MATTVNRTVRASGGDYTSLAAFAAAIPANIVTTDEIWQAECSAFVDTVAVDFLSIVTDATRYVRSYTPLAEQHTLTPGTGYRNSASSIGIFIDYIRFEGISAVKFVTGLTTLTSSVQLDACLAVGSATEGYYLGGGTVIVRNSGCIRAGAVAGFVIENNASNPDATILNCTSVGNTGNGFFMSGSVSAVIRNSYSGGNTAADYAGTWTTFQTNASSDATGSAGLQNIAYSTANLVNVTSGSENYHRPTGSALIAVGTNLTSSFTTDADRQTRPSTGPWDIGADEGVIASVLGALVARKLRGRNKLPGTPGARFYKRQEAYAPAAVPGTGGFLNRNYWWGNY